MFKIVPKKGNNMTIEVWAHGENDEVFLGGINENDCVRLRGTRVRNEYLKTYWARAEEWQDVTGGLKVEHIDGQYVQDMTHRELNIASVIGGYRFVKVEGYMVSEEIIKSVWSPGYFPKQIQQCAATLLRVERKAD